ncbi:hypothetical protein PybrP1_004028 [[Pythium] brassicae (nom. inval.)]|nr:hypothetical protein PybrP1_004028 [[Pythium] brassicae (nom. inval.)]
MADDERAVLLGTVQERQAVDDRAPTACKAGGTPAWYNPSTPPPQAEKLACPRCRKALFLVAQVYAPVEVDRSLYVFGCNSVECTETPDPSRSTWDAADDSDSSDWGDNSDDGNEDGNPFASASAADDVIDLEKLLLQRDDAMFAATTTAATASKKPKQPSGAGSAPHTSSAMTPSSFGNVFPARPIEVIDEPFEDFVSEHDYSHENALLADYMKQEEEDKSTDVGDLRKLLSSAKKGKAGAGSGGGRASASSSGESYEKTPAQQRHFLRFQKRISRCPLQCLRYDYGGEPLWPVPTPQGLQVPACVCGAERVFELQLTPTINYFLKVDAFATPIATAPAAALPSAAVVVSGSIDSNGGAGVTDSDAANDEDEALGVEAEFVFVLPAEKAFSFSSTFPTPAESAALAHADEEHDANHSQLVCGSCSSPLSQTSDLIFFKWKNGIHLSSTTDAPLRHLKPQDHWDEDAKWKGHTLLCLKCGSHVGTMAKVFASDKILFSARKVAIQMPAHQSPLISISGYPSSQLGFSYWTELILMLETQPALKDSLQIRRIDQIRDVTGVGKQLNRKLLMAKDLSALLRVVDEHSAEMNAVNISTALDRASRFLTSQATLKAVWQPAMGAATPRMTFRSSKSEAPEDLLLDISSHLMERPRSTEELAIEKKRFWDLIESAETLVNFSIAFLNSGYVLANFVVSLMRLGVGRKSILEPISKQAIFLFNSSEGKPAINAHEMSIIGTSIVHLTSKAERAEPWVKELLHTAADAMLRELELSGETCDLNVLMPLARTFIIADEFHDALFTLLFREVVAKNRLEHSPALSHYKLQNLKTRMYQIHLDCVLHGRDHAFRLPAALAAEFKDLFERQETHAKNSSFRLQHLVSTALLEMSIGSQDRPLALDRSLALAEGYSVDIAMPKHKIAIEINGADSYQVEERDESDGDAMDDKPFGFVDLKARHLEQLGWVVIQLRADKFQRLATVEDRAKHLSMLLEVASNVQRQQQQQAK